MAHRVVAVDHAVHGVVGIAALALSHGALGQGLGCVFVLLKLALLLGSLLVAAGFLHLEGRTILFEKFLLVCVLHLVDGGIEEVWLVLGLYLPLGLQEVKGHIAALAVTSSLGIPTPLLHLIIYGTKGAEQPPLVLGQLGA